MSALKIRRGARLATVRRGADLSQYQLAARVGTTRSTIARIEAGEHSPSVDLALALSRELGGSVESLFGGGR